MIANNRKYCGKCQYTEFDGKKPETPKDEPLEKVPKTEEKKE